MHLFSSKALFVAKPTVDMRFLSTNYPSHPTGLTRICTNYKTKITNQYYYTDKYLLWILFCCKIKFAANVCILILVSESLVSR